MPLPGRDVCVMHAPDMAEKVAAARMRGGAAAAKLRVLTGRRLRLDTSAAVVRFAGGLVQDVLAGTVDPDVARTVLYGLNVQLKGIELTEASEGRKLLHQVEQLAQRARQAR
jgi:hypothetical protein